MSSRTGQCFEEAHSWQWEGSHYHGALRSAQLPIVLADRCADWAAAQKKRRGSVGSDESDLARAVHAAPFVPAAASAAAKGPTVPKVSVTAIHPPPPSLTPAPFSSQLHVPILLQV